MRIIDCHAHIASFDFLPKSFFNAWSQTVTRQLGFPEQNIDRVKELLFGLLNDTDADIWIEEKRNAGIEKSVLLVIDFGLAFDDVLPIQELTDKCIKIVQKNPHSFIPFFGIDPRRGLYGVTLFEQAITAGFKGLKLYPPCGFSPSDPSLFPYYKLCELQQIPVLIHTGPSSSLLSFKGCLPSDTDDAARMFPKVNFILGHAGVVNYKEASLMAQYRSNIYLDLSGFQCHIANDELYKALHYHLKSKVGRQLLFGTDWPIHRLANSQKQCVALLKEALHKVEAKPKEIDDIFYGNAAEILNLRKLVKK